MSVMEGKIPTVPLWRVFRSTKKNADFVHHLEKECTQKYHDFGYTVSHTNLLMGHEITGNFLPLWIKELSTEHMICGNMANCSKCFLNLVEDSIEKLLKHLKEKEGIKRQDICMVVSTKELKRTSNRKEIKDHLRTKWGNDLDVKVNFELEGLERPVVVLLRNGGSIAASISHGMSRAIERLVIIGPDDEGILDAACRKGILDKSNFKLQEAQKSREISKNEYENK